VTARSAPVVMLLLRLIPIASRRGAHV